MKEKVNVILQARVNSTRLPGKIFFTFFNQTILERIIDIAKNINNIDKIILATSSRKENLILKNICKKKKIIFFNNSKIETNVLSRYKRVIRKYPSKYFIRMTCDNYLIQPDLINSLLVEFNKGSYDYGYINPLSYFSGEIIRTKFFMSTKRLITKLDKEHVTWSLRRDKSVRKIILKSNHMGINHNKIIALDELKDLIYMKNIESKFQTLKNIKCLNALRNL